MVTAPSLGAHANFHGEDREWHRSKTDAIARAEILRSKRIASLKKSITQLGAKKIRVVSK